jgi:short-subunit dehydrogenase
MKALPPLSDLISLKGRKASITACAPGIGKAMAYRFAEAGADLGLIDVNERGLRSVGEELSGFEVEINIHKVDPPSEEEIAIWWKRLKGKELDILPNKWGKCWIYLA